jgi:hypothetical protein
MKETLSIVAANSTVIKATVDLWILILKQNNSDLNFRREWFRNTYLVLVLPLMKAQTIRDIRSLMVMLSLKVWFRSY